MRRLALLTVAALLLCLPGMSEAQSCDGCGIGYRPSSLGSSGGTLTGPLLLPDGSAAAPAIVQASNTDNGIYFTTNAVQISTNGSQKFFVTPADVGTVSSSFSILSDLQGLRLGSSADVLLYRDAANTLALRNGTAAQQFNLYETYTDVSNYSRLATKIDSGYFLIEAQAAGTGTLRPIRFGTNAYFTNIYPYGDDSYLLGSTSFKFQGLLISRSIQGSKTKALTDNTATAFVRLAVADDDYEGCAIGWTAVAEDANGDARQIRKGRTNVAVLNNSGTEACNFSASADDQAILVTAGTFTCTFDCNSAAADTVDLRATCDTSLDAAAEILTFEYRLDCESTVTVTPQ